MQKSTYGPWLMAAVISIMPLMTSAAESPNRPPTAKVVELDTHGSEYLPVLGGPPETVTMRSGLVMLAPGHSVGKHTTGENEEVLIVLEGSGKMYFQNGHSLPVEANHAVYCPPRTEHDVKNTGSGTLRYVYVVSRAR